jgi:hypothetical protein
VLEGRGTDSRGGVGRRFFRRPEGRFRSFFWGRLGEGDGRTNGKRLTGKFEFGEAEESEAVKDGAQW